MTVLGRLGGLAVPALASAAYTAASFVASFVSVAIIVGGQETSGRAALFLFLALYSPLATVMSQRKLLSIYQERAHGGRAAAFEESAMFLGTLAIVMTATQHHYGSVEAVVLASTIFAHIHAATSAGAIQHRTGNAPVWSLAVLAIAAVRIGATGLFLRYGPVAAFAAGSYAYLAAMLVLRAVVARKPMPPAVEASEPPDRPTETEQWYERAASFAFFAAGAVMFQVDKYALDGAGRLAALAESGAVTLLLLSPISLLFATLYRTRTRVLFRGDLPLDEKLPAVGSIAAQFAAGSALYLGAIVAPWPGVVGIVFPFAEVPAAAFLVFALAIMADRLGTLLVFAMGGWRRYLASAVFKAIALVLIYAEIRSWTGSQSLTFVYLPYLAAGIAYLLLAGLFANRLKGRNDQA